MTIEAIIFHFCTYVRVCMCVHVPHSTQPGREMWGKEAHQRKVATRKIQQQQPRHQQCRYMYAVRPLSIPVNAITNIFLSAQFIVPPRIVYWRLATDASTRNGPDEHQVPCEQWNRQHNAGAHTMKELFWFETSINNKCARLVVCVCAVVFRCLYLKAMLARTWKWLRPKQTSWYESHRNRIVRCKLFGCRGYIASPFSFFFAHAVFHCSPGSVRDYFDTWWKNINVIEIEMKLQKYLHLLAASIMEWRTIEIHCAHKLCCIHRTELSWSTAPKKTGTKLSKTHTQTTVKHSHFTATSANSRG